jgi:hypothetical protein
VTGSGDRTADPVWLDAGGLAALGPSLDTMDREAHLMAYDRKGRYGFLRRVLDVQDPRFGAALLQVVDPHTHITLREWASARDWHEPARRNGAYIALEDQLRKYLTGLKALRARHRRTRRIRIKLVDGPAAGQEHIVQASGDAAAGPPMTWLVRDPRITWSPLNPRGYGGDLSSTETGNELLYVPLVLPALDMTWPYRWRPPDAPRR